MSTPVVVHLGARELTGVAREGESWAAAARVMGSLYKSKYFDANSRSAQPSQVPA